MEAGRDFASVTQGKRGGPDQIQRIQRGDYQAMHTSTFSMWVHLGAPLEQGQTALDGDTVVNAVVEEIDVAGNTLVVVACGVRKRVDASLFFNHGTGSLI